MSAASINVKRGSRAARKSTNGLQTVLTRSFFVIAVTLA